MCGSPFVSPCNRGAGGRLHGLDAPGTPVEPPRRVDALLCLARAALGRGDRVVVTTTAPEAPGRVAASLARRGLPAAAVPGWDAVKPGEAAVPALDLPEGFARPGLLVLSAAEALRGRGPATPGLAADEAPRVGDIAVHLDHGVTRLERLVEMEVGEQRGRRVAPGFAEGTELPVVVSGLDRVWRRGGDVGAVSPDRMSGEAWRAKRAEIEAQVGETARGLAEAAARRAAQRAPVVRPPQPAYDRLARRFAYAPPRTSARPSRPCCRTRPSGGR